MYLSKLKLWNFRKFGSGADSLDLPNRPPDIAIPFTPGLNVLIGENDSGKTAIIDAIKLILDTHSSEWVKVDIDDFYKNTTRFRIECRFDDLSDDEAKNFTEWLGMEGEGNKASPYLSVILDVSKQGDLVLPFDIRAGLDDKGYRLSAEARDYLKTTYLKPLRDAKSELMPRKNSRLSQILAGHEAFKDKDENHYLNEVFAEFNTKLEDYFKNEKKGDKKGKELKEKLEEYLNKFFGQGRSVNFSVTKKKLKDILEILKLALEEENLGLGSHNLLFIATELLNLERSNWNGLRLGLIEELEAHLHPQSQLKVIDYLQELTEQKDSKVQLILTTHSPNLGSKVKLDNLIICSKGKIFPMGHSYTKLGEPDYKFLERFLDVTKANLFFAKGVILVEGWAEELILPALAKKIACDLTQNGVSIVNVGSTAFLRYSKIFQRESGPEMEIPVSVITDVDIREYEKNSALDENGAPKKDNKGKLIYDFLKRDTQVVTQESSSKIAKLKTDYNSKKVSAFIAPRWTLEYSIFKSSSLSSIFQEVVKVVHIGTDWDSDFEKVLAEKLINKSLDKTEIAYQIAQRLEDDLKLKKEDQKITINSEDETETLNYLIKAIKHAAGKNTSN